MYGRIQNEQELFDYFGGRMQLVTTLRRYLDESEKHAGH